MSPRPRITIYWPQQSGIKCGIHLNEKEAWIARCECGYESEAWVEREGADEARCHHMSQAHGLDDYAAMA